MPRLRLQNPHIPTHLQHLHWGYFSFQKGTLRIGWPDVKHVSSSIFILKCFGFKQTSVFITRCFLWWLKLSVNTFCSVEHFRALNKKLLYDNAANPGRRCGSHTEAFCWAVSVFCPPHFSSQYPLSIGKFEKVLVFFTTSMLTSYHLTWKSPIFLCSLGASLETRPFWGGVLTVSSNGREFYKYGHIFSMPILSYTCYWVLRMEQGPLPLTLVSFVTMAFTSSSSTKPSQNFKLPRPLLAGLAGQSVPEASRMGLDPLPSPTGLQWHPNSLSYINILDTPSVSQFCDWLCHS